MCNKISLQATVPESLHGYRLDQAAAILFPDYSRGRLKGWILVGELTLNGLTKRPRDKIMQGDVLGLEAEPKQQETNIAEPMDLNIIYEDEAVLVINKSTDTVVHPAAGHRSGTLLNGLLQHCPGLEAVPRAGIVHRLDKDTTGLMVVAKTLKSHLHLVNQLQDRTVERQYQAVVIGVLTAGGTIDLPLGRHPVNRKKRAVVADGKEAVTHYRVLKRFRAHTHIRVRLETGRTHQIRVHLSHLRYPLIGDPLYSGRMHVPKACSTELRNELQVFRRQALHACRLAFIHPHNEQQVSWDCELPADMRNLLLALKRDS